MDSCPTSAGQLEANTLKQKSPITGRTMGAAVIFQRRACAIRCLFRLCLSLLLVLASMQVAAQPRGVALVIGNGAYADRPLLNATNDARDMAMALREAGFLVLEHIDLNEAAMKEALADFEDRLRASRSIGLFYFAGHGMQSTQGRNYLLPVGRAYQSERDVEFFGVAADTVLARMERVGNALNMVILDACRDAPLPSEHRSVTSRGLARMNAPSGSLIAFATAAGRTASDNPGRRNGLYTHHLLRAMRTPGLRIEDVFKTVGRAVEQESAGLQSPEEFMKLRDPTPFCFFQGRGCGPGVRLQSAEEVEQEYWNSIKTSLDPADHRDYLRRYPVGRFGPLAERQLRLLEGALASAQPHQSVQVPAPVNEKVTFTAQPLFGRKSAVATGPALTMLADLATKIREVNLEVVIAVGHGSSDEGSSPEVNKLSVARAEAIKQVLVSREGLERNRIYTEGRGLDLPVSDNRTAEGRARNRRVEVEVIGTRTRTRP